MRQFDLNIEDMLSHWEPEHALRELIANALDEQILSKTDDINIEILKHGPLERRARDSDAG